jgi:hypothetical protein
MVDYDDYYELVERVNDISTTLSRVMEVLSEHITNDTPCTCGFGGEHHEYREICQRNQERDLLMRTMEYR